MGNSFSQNLDSAIEWHHACDVEKISALRSEIVIRQGYSPWRMMCRIGASCELALHMDGLCQVCSPSMGIRTTQRILNWASQASANIITRTGPKWSDWFAVYHSRNSPRLECWETAGAWWLWAATQKVHDDLCSRSEKLHWPLCRQTIISRKMQLYMFLVALRSNWPVA